ncbi:hypothetical protein NRP93_000700 [Clostridium botulinum]|nr:hypothetical protein [Clostridium botulinum]
MQQSSFIKIYKKRWTPKIIIMIIAALIILGSVGFGFYTYNNNTNNPTIVKNLEDYKKALNNDSYIQISSDKLYTLDIVLKEKKTRHGIKISENVKSRFVAIKLPPFTLAVAIPNKEYEKLLTKKMGPYILKGNLINLKDSEVTMLKYSMQSNPYLSKNFNPTPYLQYLEYKTPLESASIYFVCAALLAIYILTLYINVMRKNTVALKSLKNFSKGSIEDTYKQIDNELNSSDLYQNGPITITKNYIIVNTQQIVFALPLKELMWVYKETIKRKAYHIIPLGKTNNIVFVFSDKRTYKVNLHKGNEIIDEVIEYISENCPYTFVGYSKELKNLLKKNPNTFISNWKEKTNTIDEINSNNISSNI